MAYVSTADRPGAIGRCRRRTKPSPTIPGEGPSLLAAAPLTQLNLDISLATWAGPRACVIVVMASFDLVVYARGHVPERAREHDLVDRLDRRRAAVRRRSSGPGRAREAGSQYLAGYLLERSLSLDNIFVFAVILSLLRRARRAGAGQGARVGHHARARPAPDLHPARRGAAGRVPHHVLLLRRAAALHGLEARPPRRRRDRARAQPGAQVHPQARDDDRGLRRRQALHARRRQARSRRRCSPSSS